MDIVRLPVLLLDVSPAAGWLPQLVNELTTYRPSLFKVAQGQTCKTGMPLPLQVCLSLRRVGGFLTAGSFAFRS